MREEKPGVDYWSEDVHTHWHPEKGFFEQPAEAIAQGLQANSEDYRQAIDRLDFYINRAGSNLSPEARQRLELAKEELKNLYGR